MSLRIEQQRAVQGGLDLCGIYFDPTLVTVVLRYEIGCHLRPRQDGSRKYEFSPINPHPGLSGVGEAAAVEPALV